MFANRLKEAREQKGLSMKQAARELNMKYTTYIGYEKNEREPNSEALLQIAEFFNLSIDFLLGRDKFVEPNDKPKQFVDNNAQTIVELYTKLDLEDKAEVRGIIKQMLKSEKYNIKKEGLA